MITSMYIWTAIFRWCWFHDFFAYRRVESRLEHLPLTRFSESSEHRSTSEDGDDGLLM